MAGIQVTLSEKTSVLEEVYATPYDSYALALLARVKKNKPTDNRTSSASPVTQTKELYVSDIGSRQLKRRLWKSLQSGMITTEEK